MVVFGGYDHYRPTMTHLLHGLLEERHNGRVTAHLGAVHGCFKVLFGWVDIVVDDRMIESQGEWRMKGRVGEASGEGAG